MPFDNPPFSGYIQPPAVPPDPTGDDWRGAPGPPGPAGVQGPPGATVGVLPVGTTAGRPNSGDPGFVRFNTDTGRYEFGVGGAWVNHVRLTGDTMTGALVVQGGVTLGSNTFAGVIETQNGILNGVRWTRVQTAGANRWQWGPGNTETGANNAGADLVYQGFSDAGANIGNSITFYRASGGVSQKLSLPMSGNTANNGPASGVFLDQTFTGNAAVTAGSWLNSLTINDNVNWSGSANGVFGLNVLHNYGGVATRGGRSAFVVTLNQVAATADLIDTFYVGGTFYGIANFNNGGSGTGFATAKGRVFGTNPVARLGAGATNYYQLVGEEIDIEVNNGASMAVRAGLALCNLDTDNNIHGAMVDAALWFYGPGNKWRDLILVGGAGQGWPADGNSSILRGLWNLTPAGAGAQPVAKFGIDLNQVTFPATGQPNDGAVLRSPGASLDGVGTLQLGTTYFTASATGLAIDAKGSVGNTANGAGAIAVGGAGYTTPSDLVTDAYGGIYRLTVAAGVPTAITVIQQPYISSHSTPANPVATIPHVASGGSGLTLNLSWNTTASTIALQAGGGAVQAGSGAWSANGSVATALSSIGPVGSHTTVQEWFTVRNAAGTVRYIPAF